MQATDIRRPDHFHRVVDCQWACPAHTPVPEYIRLIAAGRYTDAYLGKYSPASCLWFNGVCIPIPASVSTYSSYSQYFNENCILAQTDGFPYCLNPFSNGSYTSKVSLNSTSLSINPDPSGAATITVSNLQCQNGVMYGFGNGTTPSLYTIRLSRSESAIPR